MTQANRDFIAQYVTKEQNALYRLAYSYTKNESDALDVVQDAIYKALKNADSLKEPQYIKTWFYRILTNTAIDYLRKNQKYQLTDDETQFEAADRDNYQELDLDILFQVLSPQQRLIIVMRYFEDMRLNDIAEILGENLNTVKSRLYGALKKLRVTLENTEEDYCYE